MNQNTWHCIGAALVAACVSLMFEGYHSTVITAIMAAGFYLLTT